MTSMPREAAASSLTDPNHYRSFDNINMAAGDPKGPTPTRPWIEKDSEPHASPAGELTRRKRLSFFGRSSSDAATRKPPMQPLQATMSTHKDELPAFDSVPQAQPRRPMTSGSDHARRKTSDQIESIRHSIFGGRKGSRPTTKRSRQSHQAPNVGLIPFTSPLQEEVTPPPEAKGNVGAKDFRDESDFYHHRKKTSISSPFNFHHVGHTDRKNLPTRLETVDEKALSNRLLDFDAQGHALQGVPADKIRHSRLLLQSTSSSHEQVIPSRHRGSPSVDETTFNEALETKFNVEEHFNERPALRSPERVPRPSSSSPALNSPSSSSASHTIPHLHTKASFDSSSQLTHSRDPSPSCEDRPTMPVRGRPLGQSFREKQPLPPVPPQEHPAAMVGQKPSKTSLASSRLSMGQRFHPASGVNAAGYPASIASQKSKRSSKSAAPTAHSSTSTRAFSDIPVGLDWEDDIDFAFEQEAEATCDFDWEKYAPFMPPTKEELPDPSPDGSSPDSSGGGGVRLSGWIDEPSALAGGEATMNTSGLPPLFDEDGQPLHHKRGSSVGHRGFLAARNSSTDKLSAKTPPLPVEISKHAEVSTPPAISLTTDSVGFAAADEGKKSPYGMQSYFPAFDSCIPEYLSDPESTRTGGNRHRKSSSYSSFDSSGRSLQNTSASVSSMSTRWSSASTSSIPDLLHCSTYSRKRASVRKSATSGIFRTLESVPHSPDGREEPKSSVEVQARPSISDRSVSDTILMRRPATSGDRALLFQSGRVVQRGRSSTRSASRMAAPPLPQEEEQEHTWI